MQQDGSVADWGRGTAAVLLCLGVGILGGLATHGEIAGWYSSLALPGWTPPNIAFPVVWTLLYILMAASLFQLWARTAPSAQRSLALALFFVQLVLNALWSPVFFGLHWILPGLAVIALLDLTLAATIIASARVNSAAAWLLAPCLAWILYATSLNLGIAVLNPGR